MVSMQIFLFFIKISFSYTVLQPYRGEMAEVDHIPEGILRKMPERFCVGQTRAEMMESEMKKWRSGMRRWEPAGIEARQPWVAPEGIAALRSQ